MRADRLIATLLLLQTRGSLTARALAAELEVSVATARRDLEALSTAGVPVYAQPGRGGGWTLLGGARTDLTGLSAAEAQALFLLVGHSPALSPAAASALRKLLQALPRTFRSDAEIAAKAVLTDSAGWGEPDRELPDVVATLQEAVVHRTRVRFEYSGRGSVTSARVVDPWGLVDKGGRWYLVAGTTRGERTFRVDRMRDVVGTDEAAHRPADLDLAAAWSRVVVKVEQRRSVISAVVLVDRRWVPVLERQFGRQCVIDGEAPDGRVRVRIAAHLARSVAEQLAGWGSAVEVVEPAEVRAELARIGAQLCSQYGPRST